ncbi:MAG TPA: NADPH-dependent FMN reductase [Bacteroidia bacterium]|nr:NADPH-dependent FMN reductase [Bacteroidia bacterium]
MPHIAILSSSVRTKRASHRVALFFETFIREQNLATSEIVDLDSYHFPIFEERLRFQREPDAKTLEFAHKIKNADAVIIVTPEYNGGYPAALKNAIDLLYDEWYRKPVAIATVSSGNFGGSQAIYTLQFTLWKMRAWTVPVMFPVARVEESYSESGIPAEKAQTEKRAAFFLAELLWCVEALSRMKS